MDAVGTNCTCTAGDPTKTLADLRTDLLTGLGFGTAVTPPGVAAQCNLFLTRAQALLYRRFESLRLQRWWTWSMVSGTRFYDFDDDDDTTCSKTLDPLAVKWIGVSQGDLNWRPLISGIDPLRFSTQVEAIPEFYEIRQCIEVWPAPADDTWKLRIKGDFGLGPFAVDGDTATVDPDAIALHALAHAKAHYAQPDAAAYMRDLQIYLGDLTAATHGTRRYISGDHRLPNAVPPKLVT